MEKLEKKMVCFEWQMSVLFSILSRKCTKRNSTLRKCQGIIENTAKILLFWLDFFNLQVWNIKFAKIAWCQCPKPWKAPFNTHCTHTSRCPWKYYRTYKVSTAWQWRYKVVALFSSFLNNERYFMRLLFTCKAFEKRLKSSLILSSRRTLRAQIGTYVLVYSWLATTNCRQQYIDILDTILFKEGVWTVGIQKVYLRCTEGIQKVYKRYTEDIKRV